MPAPVASGWGGRRVGLAPTGKAPPCHGAHPERTLGLPPVHDVIDIVPASGNAGADIRLELMIADDHADRLAQHFAAGGSNQSRSQSTLLPKLHSAPSGLEYLSGLT
jgi:hypothetical protein